MRAAGRAAFALLGLAAAWASPPAWAGPIDCHTRRLSLTETTICQDQQLARADAQLERRLAGFARRMSLGQYLGLRHWYAESARRREVCRADRSCIAAHYRGQARFLDRLQQCLDNSLSKRNCLRGTMRSDREALRR
jgi:uncharacterized protein